MPVHECPFSDCTFSTKDVSDELAAVTLRIHADDKHSYHRLSHKPAKVESVRRPVISAGGTTEEWAYFQTRWADYKAATQIQGIDLTVQLLECCDEDLRKGLTQAAGGTLTNKSEETVLECIKALAVRRENIMVARVTLHEMHQDEGEPIRAFAARVKGQADICNFLMDCPSCSSTINYSSKVLRDIVVKGILDPEIQLDLMSEADQEMNLDEVLKYVEAKESGKQSATKLSQSLHAASTSRMRSQYRRAKTSTSHTDLCCMYCGKTGHGRSAPLKLRQKKCSAYGKVCSSCGIPNHFSELCRSRPQAPRAPFNKSSPVNTSEIANECPVWQELCSIDINSGQDVNASCTVVGHHVFKGAGKGWALKPSKPQPTIQLSVSIHQEDYKQLGINLTVRETHKHVWVSPDTCAQSCLAGFNFARLLGLHKGQLTPVKLRMLAANKSHINVLGAVIVRFSGKTKSNNTVETRQMVYISDSTDKLYLSREACEDLGIVSHNFPTINDTSEHSIYSSHSVCTSDLLDRSKLGCDCPQRSLPPAKPTKLPFKVNNYKDVERLKTGF